LRACAGKKGGVLGTGKGRKLHRARRNSKGKDERRKMPSLRPSCGSGLLRRDEKLIPLKSEKKEERHLLPGRHAHLMGKGKNDDWEVAH